MPGRISRRSLVGLHPTTSSHDHLVHIASLLVQHTAEAGASIRECVARWTGAEVHATGHPGKLAVVLEAAESGAIGRACDELWQLTGVISVSIVAHLTESAQAMDEEVAQ